MAMHRGLLIGLPAVAGRPALRLLVAGPSTQLRIDAGNAGMEALGGAARSARDAHPVRRRRG